MVLLNPALEIGPAQFKVTLQANRMFGNSERLFWAMK